MDILGYVAFTCCKTAKWVNELDIREGLLQIAYISISFICKHYSLKSENYKTYPDQKCKIN